MKKLIITSILLSFLFAGTMLMAQEKQDDYLGLPGDNLNLYAVMRLFQQSKTLEDFERSLNDPDTKINNLDLNGDGLVDYIKVFDDVDGDVHNIVLQVAVSQRENQDVAVFSVQRLRDGQVQLQLTGDEELYGKNYIIEPIYGDAGETPNPGYAGNTRTVNGQTVTYVTTTPVQIAAWPLVRFIYLPSYTGWRSNWYWGYYPSYWRPWHSYSWNYYYGYHYNWNNDYYGNYRRWDYHRYSRWNDFYYTGRRSYSTDVRHHIAEGNYKSTYSHPEQRRDGEAKFAEMHPDQYRRSSNNSSGNTNVERRSSTSVSRRGVTNRPNDNNNVISRRSSNSVTSRPETNNPSNRNTVKTRKSETTVTEKPVMHQGNQGNNVTRRSENSVTNKSVGNQGSVRNAGTNKSSTQIKRSEATSTRRKSNKAATTVKKDNKNKDSDNKDSGRRR